jgi:hypothetical protein
MRWLLGFLALSAVFQARGFSPDGLLSDPRLVGSDYSGYVAPYAAFIQRELRAGHLPLWNPYILTGVPVVEPLLPQALHPFTALLLVLPFERALTVLAVIRPAVAGWGAFLLARTLGVGPPAAALAGLLFAFSPFHLLMRFEPVADVSALIPFLLLASELSLRATSSRRAGALWALVAALMMLGGHSETAVHGIALAWGYHVMRAAALARPGERWRRVARSVAFLLGCSTLAALAADVAVWGHTALLLDSHAMVHRAGTDLYRGLPRAHVRTFLDPQAFPVPSTGYLGIVTLALAAGGAVGRGPFPAWPWLVIGGTAFLAAYGIWPVGALVKLVPIVRLAHHSRLIIVVHLALALLAARGVERLVAGAKRRAFLLGVLGVALGLLVAFLVPADPFAGRARWLNLAPQAAFLALGALGLAGMRFLPGRIAAWAFAGIVLLDLFATLAPGPPGKRLALAPRPPLFDVVQDGGEGRLLVPHQLVPSNLNMVHGLATITGYEPAMPHRTAALLGRAGLAAWAGLGIFPPLDFSSVDLRLLSLLNVRYIVLHPRRQSENVLAARLEAIPGAPIYRNPSAFPRAFAVERITVAAGPDDALAQVADPSVDLARVAVLEEPVPTPPPPATDAGQAPAVTILDYRPGEVRLEATTSAGGVLVLSESFLPGWRATLDGGPVPVLRADYALLGVALPPGTHEVVFRYRPRSVIVGGAVSLASILALVAAVVLPHRSRSIARACRRVIRPSGRMRPSR